MNRDRGAAPGPGSDGVQAVIGRDRAAAGGPMGDTLQPAMSRDRPGSRDEVQTMVSPESGEVLDAGAAGEKRLFSGAGSRDPQAVENHTEPPLVLAPPQQVRGAAGLNFMKGLCGELVNPGRFRKALNDAYQRHDRGDRNVK